MTEHFEIIQISCKFISKPFHFILVLFLAIFIVKKKDTQSQCLISDRVFLYMYIYIGNTYPRYLVVYPGI